jgi:hypothetical protein
VDLQGTYNITEVKLNWEAAYAKSYQIQVSSDAVNWTNIYSTAAGAGGIEDRTGLSGTGRYVRLYGTVRQTVYGYSLWEMEVYGTAQPSKPSLIVAAITNQNLAFWITGDTGVNHTIHVSSNLTSWLPVGAINLTLSPYLWVDTNSMANPRRFYRVSAGP